MGITTDSGSNVKLAYDLLRWNRLSCFGHNLNLAVGKGLNDGRVQCTVEVQLPHSHEVGRNKET